MKKLLLSLLTVVATCVFAWSQDTETLTTFKFWDNNSSYQQDNTSTSKCLGTTWVASNFNNNNNSSSWKQIRCGRNGNASVASIYNSDAIAETITKIVAEVTFPQTGSLNGAKLYVSDDASFTTSSIFSLSDYSTAGDWEFIVPEEAVGSNKFYKLEFDCKSSTKNGFLGITTLTFYKGAGSGTPIDPTPSKCATPTFSVINGANIVADDVVTINCTTPDATIFYHFDEETEWTSTPAPATIHFDTDGEYKITAYAAAEGLENSAEATISVTYSTELPPYVTFDFLNKDYDGLSERGGSAYDKEATIKEGIVTMELACEAGNGYRLWNDGLRLYNTSGKLNTMTIYATNATITSVEVDYAATVGTVSVNGADAVDAKGTATYTINADKAVLAYNVTANKAIKTIKVNYATKSNHAEDAKLSFGEKTSYSVGFGTEFTAPTLINPKNVEVTYSSSNEEVATVDNNGNVTILAKGTTEIKAVPVDTERYFGEARYTITVQVAYNSIAEMIEKGVDGDICIVNMPLTVGYVNGANVFTTDGKGGYIQIYMHNNNLEALDVIPAGWTAEYDIYYGLPELKPVSLPAVTEKGEYEIQTITNPQKAYLNQVIKVPFITFEHATEADTKTNFYGYINGYIWQFRNTLGSEAVDAGTYNVTLVASTFDPGAHEVVEVNQLLPISYELLPEIPTVKVDDEETDSETYISLDGREKVVIELGHADTDNHTIFHKFVALAPAAQAEEENDGFVEYTDRIEITEAGTLHFYAQHKTTGLKSKNSTITFTGSTTSIAEIEAGEVEAEYFDLSGRRVAAPAKGIVIKKTGSKVSKLVF